MSMPPTAAASRESEKVPPLGALRASHMRWLDRCSQTRTALSLCLRHSCLNAAMTEQQTTKQPAMESSKLESSAKHGPEWSWRGIATVCFVVALGSLGGILLVILVFDKDALTTIALGLAVLSFAATLIITAVQGHQSWHIFTSTNASLVDIRTASRSLLEMQSRHFERVLDAALGKSFRAADQEAQTRAESIDGDDVDPQSLITQVMQSFASRLDRELRAATHNTVSGVPYVPPMPSSSSTDRDPAILELIRTFPPEEQGRPVYEELKSLRVRSVAALGKVASQVQRHPRADRTVRFAKSQEGPNPDFIRLIDQRYLKRLPERDTDTGATLQITEKGFIALRLIAAKGEQPAWMDS